MKPRKLVATLDPAYTPKGNNPPKSAQIPLTEDLERIVQTLRYARGNSQHVLSALTGEEQGHDELGDQVRSVAILMHDLRCEANALAQDVKVIMQFVVPSNPVHSAGEQA